MARTRGRLGRGVTRSVCRARWGRRPYERARRPQTGTVACAFESSSPRPSRDPRPRRASRRGARLARLRTPTTARGRRPRSGVTDSRGGVDRVASATLLDSRLWPSRDPFPLLRPYSCRVLSRFDLAVPEVKQKPLDRAHLSCQRQHFVLVCRGFLRGLHLGPCIRQVLRGSGPRGGCVGGNCPTPLDSAGPLTAAVNSRISPLCPSHRAHGSAHTRFSLRLVRAGWERCGARGTGS